MSKSKYVIISAAVIIYVAIVGLIVLSKYNNEIFEYIMSEKLGDIEYTEEEYLNLGADYKETDNMLDVKTEIDIIDIKSYSKKFEV